MLTALTESTSIPPAEASSLIALTAAQLSDVVDNPDVQTTCEVCDGTKRSGDGLGPCPCGKNCECEKPAEVRNKRAIFFVADWCSDCKKMEEESADVLAKSNWTAGEESSNHIQIANVARSLNLFKKYHILSIPTMILIKNGKEINRHVGFLKWSKMKDFWEDNDDDNDDDDSDSSNDARQRCQCDTDTTFCNCESKYGVSRPHLFLYSRFPGA